MGALPSPDLPPGAHHDLVRGLHDLHHRAGWPSLRALARRTGVSHTTVSKVLGPVDACAAFPPPQPGAEDPCRSLAGMNERHWQDTRRHADAAEGAQTLQMLEVHVFVPRSDTRSARSSPARG